MGDAEEVQAVARLTAEAPRKIQLTSIEHDLRRLSFRDVPANKAMKRRNQLKSLLVGNFDFNLALARSPVVLQRECLKQNGKEGTVHRSRYRCSVSGLKGIGRLEEEGGNRPTNRSNFGLVSTQKETPVLVRVPFLE